jgi:hypothetical protein
MFTSRKTTIDDINKINSNCSQAEKVFDLLGFGLSTFSNEQIDCSLEQYNNYRWVKRYEHKNDYYFI